MSVEHGAVKSGKISLSEIIEVKQMTRNVDIKPICYECQHNAAAGEMLVGRISEGGGYEPAHECLRDQCNCKYTVNTGCYTKNQCLEFDPY
jgi:hypothetical protein